MRSTRFSIPLSAMYRVFCAAALAWILVIAAQPTTSDPAAGPSMHGIDSADTAPSIGRADIADIPSMGRIGSADAIPSIGQVRSADDIPSKGTPSTFEAATWNLQWFGSPSNGPDDDGLQLRNAVRIMRDSDIDLWAVQEIDDEQHFRRLVDELGDGWAGEISTAGSNFKTGYVYKTSVVFVRQKSAILTRYSSDFAGRPPLQIEADVMLPHDTVRVVFITLHMKAFNDDGAYEQRTTAAVRLKEHVDDLLDGRRVIVLGDFNDELAASITTGRPSPYANLLDDTARYAFLTRELDTDDRPTWCRNASCTSGSSFDHILVTDELFASYTGGSAARFVEVLDAIESFTSTTSDHLPVFARFTFSKPTSAHRPRRQVGVPLSAHPNPFDVSTLISGATARAGPARLTLYDTLGRAVRRMDSPYRLAGPFRFRVDGIGLAAGVYVAAVEHADGASIVRLIRTR